MLHSLRQAFTAIGLAICTSPLLAQSDIEPIRQYLTAHCADWRLAPSDVSGIEIVSEAPSKAKGVTHVYVRQLVNGLRVSNGLATVTLKEGKVVHVASRLKSNLASASATPAIDAATAVQQTAGQLGIVYKKAPVMLSAKGNDYLFDKSDLSRNNIPVTLVYTVGDDNQLHLAWDLSIATTDGQHWWSVRVDAQDGTLLERNDWISHCSFDECFAPDHNHSVPAAQEPSALMAPPPPGADQYRVYALPLESPNHGNRTVLVNPSDAVASPFGWHDTDGLTGDEFTITRGNNVYASEDIDDDDIPGYSPDGTAALDFDFAYDSLAGVQGNHDAVITNLFYMNNMMHDIWYLYGFDEPSGNFQSMNYGGIGDGNDFVYADAQDGSGSNNANFGTPPEGNNPRMQMYLWSDNNVPDLLTVNSPATIAQTYPCSTAGFGPPVPSVPITADFVIVNDGVGDSTDGCEMILNTAEMSGKIALVRRGTCTFGSKVQACQDAGAIAVIVMNNGTGAPIAMGGQGPGVTIPSIMVSQANGNLFVNTIIGGETVNGTLVNPGDLTATDSDFDNMIIAHEYGHGISTRLTGGAENSDCLHNEDQMGEGWSDWFGLMITMEPGDQAADPRGVGTYVTNQPLNGTGIRPAPYSTSFAVNDFTYASTNNTGAISEPHGIGFVWASMLWDLNWALIGEYGFDPDVKNGNGGNNMAMALVIEGLKLQPCEPGFVDGRDAILAADEIIFGGVNKCLIWEVFARRGLGFSAGQGDSDDRTDQTEAFDLHPDCIEGAGLEDQNLENVSIYPNPAKDLLNIDMTHCKQVTSIRIVDLQGKVLYETTEIGSEKLTVDLSVFRSGIYLVQLTDINGAKAVEIVKH
jgi:hypothetical protein